MNNAVFIHHTSIQSFFRHSTSHNTQQLYCGVIRAMTGLADDKYSSTAAPPIGGMVTLIGGARHYFPLIIRHKSLLPTTPLQSSSTRQICKHRLSQGRTPGRSPGVSVSLWKARRGWSMGPCYALKTPKFSCTGNLLPHWQRENIVYIKTTGWWKQCKGLL